MVEKEESRRVVSLDQEIDALDALGFDSSDESIQKQFHVFIEALKVYEERNKRYKDNFAHMGWRGMLIRVRERAERLWDSLWSESSKEPDLAKLDDAIDLINFAGFLVRAVREENRDGFWWKGIN